MDHRLCGIVYAIVTMVNSVHTLPDILATVYLQILIFDRLCTRSFYSLFEFDVYLSERVRNAIEKSYQTNRAH